MNIGLIIFCIAGYVIPLYFLIMSAAYQDFSMLFGIVLGFIFSHSLTVSRLIKENKSLTKKIKEANK